MISTKYNFIFIHIRKTAGNSIQAALMDFADDRVVFRNSVGHVINDDGRQGLDVFNSALGFEDQRDKHATIRHYQEKLGEKLHQFFVFTCIRNPFDRVISRTAFKMGPLKKQPQVSELVLPKPMMNYLKLGNRIAVNNFIRFETLQDYIAAICQKLNIQKTELPHLNSSERSNYRDYYTEETRALVTAKYAEELDFFNYTF